MKNKALTSCMELALAQCDRWGNVSAGGLKHASRNVAGMSGLSARSAGLTLRALIRRGLLVFQSIEGRVKYYARPSQPEGGAADKPLNRFERIIGTDEVV